MHLPLDSTAVAFAASSCLNYLLVSYGRAQSQGKRQPAAATPPLFIHIHIFLWHVFRLSFAVAVLTLVVPAPSFPPRLS